jgi:hypothetical protein
LVSRPAGHLWVTGGTRGLAGGFFDELKKSFRKEAEQNKEFQESLRRLRVRPSKMELNIGSKYLEHLSWFIGRAMDCISMS